MRFHLVGLPHTQSTAEYSNCAFNSLTRGFAKMMSDRGHEVILYSGEDNDAEVARHITCITKEQQKEMLGIEGPDDFLKPPLDSTLWDVNQPVWKMWNRSVMREMMPLLKQRDFVCLIGGGVLFEPLITKVKPYAIPVEYAVGYGGISANTFHAFGSSNWQHVMYGIQHDPSWRGNFYDRVIPHYFDPKEFEYREEKSDYFLYLGKLKEDKGINVAARACKAAGERLILAGQGPTPVEYGEVLRRRVGPDERRELLAGAKGVFVPSLYVEPFGMIAVEALLSGTPIITTPWGGLGEINDDGRTGFKCNTLKDFVNAVRDIKKIDPLDCLNRGLSYSYNEVGRQYERWFKDLTGLWGEGWGEL